MPILSDRLKNKEIILLDGGVSTEIQKRGVAMDNDVWSGIAHITHPEITLQVHEDYIRAGSQVITTNTFSTARHVLESIDMGDQVRSINEEAVKLAFKARDNAADDEVWIAGSISSMAPFNNEEEVALGEGVESNYREMAEILAESGVDLLIVEMMRETVNSILVIKAALATGLPVWIGYSAMMAEDGKNVINWRWKNVKSKPPTDDFEQMVKATIHLGGDAAGIMHSQVKDTVPALEVMSKHWNGPKLVYAETGALEKPDWNFKEICTPEKYSELLKDWVNIHGVQIVGGCCGTGPEHIRILKEQMPKHLP